MSVKTMSELFSQTLRDTYYAERQLGRILPKMARKATSADLKKVFETKSDLVGTQIDRLDSILDHFRIARRGGQNEAVDGMLAEAQDVMAEVETEMVRDFGLLAAAEVLQHYKLSRYRTLLAWADQFGLPDVISLLRETLVEEEQVAEALSKISLSAVNRKAA